MKKKNSFFRLLTATLCAFILLGACTAASFAVSESTTPIIRTVTVPESGGDSGVQIICSDLPYISEDVRVNGNYSVEIDGNAVEVKRSSFDEKNIPLTVVCLFDTSNSNSKLDLAKDIATGLAEKLGNKDNFVIGKISDKLEMGEPISGIETIKDAIEGVKGSGANSNLYNGIAECVQMVNSSKVFHKNKILLILSAGSNYTNNGKTAQEVTDEIKAVRFPVYTVALVKNVDGISNGKTFGSFARASCGGLALSTVDENQINHIRNNVPASEFYDAIWRSVCSAAVLDVSVPNKYRDSKEASLIVQFGTDSQVFTDKVTVNMTVKDTDQGTKPVEDSGFIDRIIGKLKDGDILVYCVIGVAAVVVVLLIVLLVGNKKKKAQVDQFDGYDNSQQQFYPTNGSDFYNQGETKTSMVDDIVATSVAASARYQVMFDDIPYGRNSRRFEILEGAIKSFGRSGQKSDYELNPADAELSGKHFSMVVSGNGICVRDENSTNGTQINGVRLKPSVWTRINSGDKIKAGACEYRVTVR